MSCEKLNCIEEEPLTSCLCYYLTKPAHIFPDNVATDLVLLYSGNEAISF